MKRMAPRAVMVATAVLLVSGCMPRVVTTTKQDAFPGMYEESPVAILVLPAVNHSTAADAPILYSSTVNEQLSNAGFYVLPIEITERFLRNEGLSEGAQLKDVAPQKFAGLFGADAVLYVTIYKWDTNYSVLAGNVTVGIEFEMKSCKSGETLYLYESELVVDTTAQNNSSTGHPLADLFAQMIATAITTASQDYVPIARSVNATALSAVPFGKYHKQHGKDQTVKILMKNTGRKEAAE